jgi:hypothetical protein
MQNAQQSIQVGAKIFAFIDNSQITNARDKFDPKYLCLFFLRVLSMLVGISEAIRL